MGIHTKHHYKREEKQAKPVQRGKFSSIPFLPTDSLAQSDCYAARHRGGSFEQNAKLCVPSGPPAAATYNVRGDEHPGGKIKVPSEIQSVGKGPLYRDGRNQGSEPFKHLEEAARAKPEGDHRTGKLVELRLSGEGNAAGR